MTIHVGLVTAVLGDRFRNSCGGLSPEAQAQWWKRTDYGWTCSACPNTAGVGYSSRQKAQQSADEHRDEHAKETKS